MTRRAATAAAVAVALIVPLALAQQPLIYPSKGLPGEVGAPAFIRIDFGQQAMVGPKRSSPIKVTERSEQALLLMGTELGYGWTVVLDQTTGEMTATMTNGAGSFVFFGACTPL